MLTLAYDWQRLPYTPISKSARPLDVVANHRGRPDISMQVWGPRPG
jgi:hypothetical protein